MKLCSEVAQFRVAHLWLAEGTVTVVHKDGCVAVSLGRDQGVGDGHVLQVARISPHNEVDWIKMVVLEASLDTARCHPVENRFVVRAGDRVVVPLDAKVLLPPGIEGVVLAVQGNGLLEISLGSDDGIVKGAVLSVSRADGGVYLGKVEVVGTTPDRAVCKVLRDTQKGVITKGDRVYSAELTASY